MTTPKSGARRCQLRPFFWAMLATSISITPALASPEPVQLPVEVMAATATSRSVSFNASASAVSRAAALSLRVHGLSYTNKASIQINAGPVIPLNNTTVSVAEPGKLYGGIGGPLGTLDLSLSLPANLIRSGENTLRFVLNGTDGLSTGYRVLSFNLLDNASQELLDSSTFTLEDPTTWQPPRNTPSDIATGRQLWYSAALRSSSLPTARMMQARCTDCHAHDGRDLKYFNYSNYAITERAKFHGLTEVQGEQIASYIRSLQLPSPGRPWNPPYQPGPGRDGTPLVEWAAGAGLDAVLARDADALPYIFPNGVSRAPIERDAQLNLREIPVAMQLPDWNHWLPQIHPKDAWGASFISNNAFKLYAGEGTGSLNWNLRQRLTASTGYPGSKTGFYADVSTWNDWLRGYLFNQRPPSPLYYDPARWPAGLAEKMHSTRLWQLIKLWEMHQEFGMEGRGAQLFGAKGDPRTWLSTNVWEVAPFELWIPRSVSVGLSPVADQPVVNNYSPSNLYFTNSWFYLQLLLNSSNGEKRAPYTPGALEYLNEHMRATSYLGDRQPLRNLVGFIKSIQIRPSADPVFAPNQGSGWNPYFQNPIQLGFNWPGLWDALPQDTRVEIMQAVVDMWVDKNRDYPVSSYPQVSNGGYYDPAYLPPTPGDKLGARTWSAIESFRVAGVDIANASAWAKTMWAAWPTAAVTAPALSTVSVSPTSLSGLGTSTLTVTLNQPAPLGGVVVSLRSASLLVSLPSTVTVPAGSTSAAVTFSAPTVALATTVTLEATLANVTKSATLSLQLPPTQATLGTLSLGVTDVIGGCAVTGTVTLTAPAPATGFTILLSSSDTDRATVPISISLPGGSTKNTFSVVTKSSATAGTVVISAALNGINRTANLTVKMPAAQPALTQTTVSPTTRTGGEAATGKVSLAAPVPVGCGALVVYLTSSNGAATVPNTVIVAEGQQSATFSITTTPVAATTNVTITATTENSVKSGVLSVVAPGFATLALNRTGVKGGTALTATVSLYGPAPASGILIALESSNPSAVPVPSTVLIPAGASSFVFNLSTNTTAATQDVVLSATLGSVKKTKNLAVTP